VGNGQWSLTWGEEKEGEGEKKEGNQRTLGVLSNGAVGGEEAHTSGGEDYEKKVVSKVVSLSEGKGRERRKSALDFSIQLSWSTYASSTILCASR
jgi:hypothetical protein